MFKKELKTIQLDFVLNPANYGVVYPDALADRENHDEKNKLRKMKFMGRL